MQSVFGDLNLKRWQLNVYSYNQVEHIAWILSVLLCVILSDGASSFYFSAASRASSSTALQQFYTK